MSRNNKLKEICKNIIKTIYERNIPEETQVYALSNEIARILSEEKDFKYPKEYQELSVKIQQVSCCDIKELSAEQAFLYGRMCGIIEIVRQDTERKKEEKAVTFFTEKYKGSIETFATVTKEPGITKSKLMSVTGLSSKDLKEMVNNELLICQRIVQVETYWMTSRGTTVYNRLQQNQ